MKNTTDHMPELTRGEEEVMQILWELGAGSVNEIIARMREPKPKYTTVATFVKILENKGFIAREARGRGFLYTPTVEREEYAKSIAKNMLHSYFDGSVSNMVSFFSKHENLSVQELDQIYEIIEKIKKQ